MDAAKMDAVVFDLFGTLTDPAPEVSRQTTVEATGHALGISPEQFWASWCRSFPERITGGYGGTRATLRRLSEECGVEVEDEILTTALEAHLASMETLLAPRPGALEVLDELRTRGFQLALMSDCTSEVVEAWEDSPYASRFDTAVLSWSEGLRKPDQRLYAAAATRIGVSPSRCWYVGDGGGREHTGALEAGMTPVLVTNAGTPSAAILRADADGYLPALQVDGLENLLTVIGHPATSPARRSDVQKGR